MCRSVLLGLLILLASAVGAQDKPPASKAPAQRADGASSKADIQALLRLLPWCRRPGDRPAALMLRTTPPDLTTLAKRHGGKFPYDYVSDVLRFGSRIRSHGDRSSVP